VSTDSNVPAPQPPAEGFDPGPHACPGACNSLYRRKGLGFINEGNPVLCGKCSAVLRSELLGLDTLAGMLAAREDGFRGSTGSDAAIRAHRNAGSKRSPSPETDLISELEDCLREWMSRKRPVMPQLGYLARPVTECSSWLVANLFMYLPDPELATGLYDDVRRWHSMLAKRAKAGPALVSKPVPCPRCRERGLVQERGAEIVKCTKCGRMMGIGEYESLAAEGAEAADAAKVDTANSRAGLALAHVSL